MGMRQRPLFFWTQTCPTHSRPSTAARPPPSTAARLPPAHRLAYCLECRLAHSLVLPNLRRRSLADPDFYPKLYRLFDGTIFYAKYRSRFFRQADLFLKSK